jgi:hypothetical protein
MVSWNLDGSAAAAIQFDTDQFDFLIGFQDQFTSFSPVAPNAA